MVSTPLTYRPHPLTAGTPAATWWTAHWVTGLALDLILPLVLVPAAAHDANAGANDTHLLLLLLLAVAWPIVSRLLERRVEFLTPDPLAGAPANGRSPLQLATATVRGIAQAGAWVGCGILTSHQAMPGAAVPAVVLGGFAALAISWATRDVAAQVWDRQPGWVSHTIWVLVRSALPGAAALITLHTLIPAAAVPAGRAALWLTLFLWVAITLARQAIAFTNPSGILPETSALATDLLHHTHPAPTLTDTHRTQHTGATWWPLAAVLAVALGIVMLTVA